jgi:hypothetical protein
MVVDRVLAYLAWCAIAGCTTLSGCVQGCSVSSTGWSRVGVCHATDIGVPRPARCQ